MSDGTQHAADRTQLGEQGQMTAEDVIVTAIGLALVVATFFAGRWVWGPDQLAPALLMAVVVGIAFDGWRRQRRRRNGTPPSHKA